MSHRKFQAAAGTAVAAVAAGMVTGTAAGPAEAASHAHAQDGWVRLAHLSPDTPAVDVYLYAFGGTSAEIVLEHVGYGDASPYEPLPQGLYTVAMRSAGASASTPPVISANVDVKAGAAYTVAGLGPFANLTLNVLSDRLTAPAHEADVRVIQASLRSPSVTVSAGGHQIGGSMHFPAVSDYRAVAAGPSAIAVKTPVTSVTSVMNLRAGSTYTLAVLDGQGTAPKILDLTDSVGVDGVPKGGVAAGLGGAADRGLFGPQEEAMLWGGLLVAGALGVGLSVRRLRRF